MRPCLVWRKAQLKTLRAMPTPHYADRWPAFFGRTRTVRGQSEQKGREPIFRLPLTCLFSIRIWLRGVDLNHRPLGYECSC